MIRKLMIANRGEIAIRIARTARRMGIKTVGVFSELDRNSLHLDACDEVYSLGDGTVAETYLNISRLAVIMKGAKVDAVHPGYGFLSERANFAEACMAAGIIFVGPTPTSIKEMGDKISAKELMKKIGVPLVPGSDGAITLLADARKVADRVGYPILLKAAAGGGGKGMRIVRGPQDLEAALEGAAREAKAYFGDGTVFIEKYLDDPHHVEVQVLGDGHGGGGHVFDRECSIQRRHQKLLEESPAPLLLRYPASKEKILEVAGRVVEQMKYANAGTLEFVTDDHGEFYFLEMNTRLQVEHPVTEWVTGIDLVEFQLRVAAGETLLRGPLVGEQRGHSIEVRIYAETPFDHIPTGGRVMDVIFPQGPFLRIDSSIYSGYEVPTDYDPTLLKLSVWGQDRAQAISRLKGAVEELRILGVNSNQALFWAISQEKDFIEGMYGTPYLDRHREGLKDQVEKTLAQMYPHVVLGLAHTMKSRLDQSNSNSESPWSLSAKRIGMQGSI